MDNRVDDLVRAAVKEAIDTGELLHVEQESRRIAASLPHGVGRAKQIAELLLRAGVSAHVSLAWGEAKAR
jgi:hypothetical protein